MKILIIDDNSLIRKNIKKTLNELQIDSDEVSNGQEGLNAIRDNYYDIIISDIDMPVMGGLEFSKKSQSNHKILFISSGDIDKITGICLKKPFTKNELINKLNLFCFRLYGFDITKISDDLRMAAPKIDAIARQWSRVDKDGIF